MRGGEGVLGRQRTMLKCPKMFKCPNPAVFEEVKTVQLNRERVEGKGVGLREEVQGRVGSEHRGPP